MLMHPRIDLHAWFVSPRLRAPFLSLCPQEGLKKVGIEFQPTRRARERRSEAHGYKSSSRLELFSHSPILDSPALAPAKTPPKSPPKATKATKAQLYKSRGELKGGGDTLSQLEVSL